MSKTAARKGLRLDRILKIMKEDLEEVISSSSFNGEKKKNGHEAAISFIRSQGLINHMHDHIKDQFIQAGVDPDDITPAYGESKPERSLAGYYKNKQQDLVIASESVWDKDTERAICINLRSQFSSVDKNYDTIMERTAFEPLNTRLNYPEMILGDVFILPVRGYLPAALKNNQIEFDRPTGIEKYIDFFKSVNRPTAPVNNKMADKLTYDRVAVLVVDFSKKEPRVYQTGKELLDDGYTEKEIDLSPLSIDNFCQDILLAHAKKFPKGYR